MGSNAELDTGAAANRPKSVDLRVELFEPVNSPRCSVQQEAVSPSVVSCPRSQVPRLRVLRHGRGADRHHPRAAHARAFAPGRVPARTAADEALGISEKSLPWLGSPCVWGLMESYIVPCVAIRAHCGGVLGGAGGVFGRFSYCMDFQRSCVFKRILYCE